MVFVLLSRVFFLQNVDGVQYEVCEGGGKRDGCGASFFWGGDILRIKTLKELICEVAVGSSLG